MQKRTSLERNEIRTAFQHVIFNPVVIETIRDAGQARDQHIGFGRVQVAAGRVGTHGPAVRAVGFPCSNAQRQLQ